MTGGANRESDKFMLRLPDGMRDQVKDLAAENRRSMNAEILAALEAWLGASNQFTCETAASKSACGKDLPDTVTLHMNGRSIDYVPHPKYLESGSD
ncbi:Arc family DNA-binding protein [Chachezhania sediminis]|uniref:Arc family DNA-binding protein n=1 Tax=Chachezhania sediminis TaxID=2599291 RepID=UPI00131EB959|nr:Arc family DNA-binding protein [Chachezhania sediminis]